jgi:hypothetical protein
MTAELRALHILANDAGHHLNEEKPALVGLAIPLCRGGRGGTWSARRWTYHDRPQAAEQRIRTTPDTARSIRAYL